MSGSVQAVLDIHRVGLERLLAVADGPSLVVELPSVSDEVARVRLTPIGTLRASVASRRAAVATAVGRAAPEIGGVEIEGLDT
ncbi:MAG TPA: hypothetical protein VKE22_20160 [Haliangiales bacterium]|nr:hypothetical protein [Haliangiales bacterium]